jgi:hypothetical protein
MAWCLVKKKKRRDNFTDVYGGVRYFAEALFSAA